MNEWKSIAENPRYEVSREGSVRRGERLMVGAVDQDGYRQVTLSDRGMKVTRRVHRLVLTTFVGPPPPNLQCRHLNGDRLDNRLQNLAWGTVSQNMLDKVRHGTHHMANKTHCPAGHPYDAGNTYLRPKGRDCKICRLERSLERGRRLPRTHWQRDALLLLVEAYPDPALLLPGPTPTSIGAAGVRIQRQTAQALERRGLVRIEGEQIHLTPAGIAT